MTPREHGSGGLIYVMRVERAFTFAEYYKDAKFRIRLDNIYRPRKAGGYTQERNDFHGPKNILKDLSADRVLVSKTFVYFGDEAPAIPVAFREFVPKGQGHRVFGNALGEPDDPDMSARIKLFVRWALSHGSGLKGDPSGTPCSHYGCSS